MTTIITRLMVTSCIHIIIVATRTLKPFPILIPISVALAITIAIYRSSSFSSSSSLASLQEGDGPCDAPELFAHGP